MTNKHRTEKLSVAEFYQRYNRKDLKKVENYTLVEINHVSLADIQPKQLYLELLLSPHPEAPGETERAVLCFDFEHADSLKNDLLRLLDGSKNA